MNNSIMLKVFDKQTKVMSHAVHLSEAIFSWNLIWQAYFQGQKEISGCDLLFLFAVGLFDKEGIAIYEGDILRDDKGKDGYVFYNPKIAAYMVNCGEENFFLNEGNVENETTLKYTRIVGNIYTQ